MSAKKRGRKTEESRAKKGRAEKEATTRKKVTVPKQTMTKAHRASTAKRKGAKASPSLVKAGTPREEMPAAAGYEAPPVGIVEVTSVEVVAIEHPFASP